MLIGPSDMYGDLDLEDVDEFEGLEGNDEREIDPGGRFQRDEFRSFELDFEYELEEAELDDDWSERMDGEQRLDEVFEDEEEQDFMDPLFDPEGNL